MYIYNGHLGSAHAKAITVVFPAGLELSDPCCAYWQSIEGGDVENVCLRGIIKTVTKDTQGEGIYSLTAELSDDFVLSCTIGDDINNISAEIRSSSTGETIETTLQAQYPGWGETRVPIGKVYTGTITWESPEDSYVARNEMVTLVIPKGIRVGAPVGLYWQWTVDRHGDEHVNVCLNTGFDTVHTSADQLQGTFRTPPGLWYEFTVTFPLRDEAKVGELQMRLLADGPPVSTTSVLQQRDERQEKTHGGDFRKKALIIRYGTGTDDNGINLVRDMLVDLSFDADNIEMLYYKAEPDGAPAEKEKGIEAPTASNFKSRFISLLEGAVAGDVRFVYVETRGVVHPGSDLPPDSIDNGWSMASGDDGTGAPEVVTADYISQIIKENVKPGVNLTILTSSCIGSGMLGGHYGTPGVVLAGCNATQTNFKALPTVHDGSVDPFVYGVVASIKYQATNFRSVPTYAKVYNDAKKFIARVNNRRIRDERYRGPSPNEQYPDGRSDDLKSSNQDPQLAFYNEYLDPDRERFLAPFSGIRGGYGEGLETCFPKDEYAGDLF
ncbi:hypothetical protein EV715DRAFT_189566 [Schizophyllum commune]